MQELIYGCMGLGGSWSDEPHAGEHVDEAAAAVEAALDAGITLFDHADIYRSGKSEAVFGEVLAATPGLRDRIRLQTKCGIRLNERGLQTHYDLSREAILERVNGSLKRLRTDFVDILLLHRPDPLADPAEVASAVGQLIAEGKVRQLGVSNMSGAQIEALQDRLETPVVANQLEMSLLKRAWLESQVLSTMPSTWTTAFPTAPWSTASGTALPCRPTAPSPGASTRVPNLTAKPRQRRPPRSWWRNWRGSTAAPVSRCCSGG
jgi:predicted oxidoreductase